MFMFRWLWKNMEGCRALYICALLLTVVCQALTIFTPYFSGQITDIFIVSENAVSNLQTKPELLIYLLIGMFGFTLLRSILMYSTSMMYEHSSQTVIYRVRKVLFDKIEQQDARFYNVYRTGDIMTRVTSDLDMVRHSLAWIIKAMVECFVQRVADFLLHNGLAYGVVPDCAHAADSVNHMAFQAQGGTYVCRPSRKAFSYEYSRRREYLGKPRDKGVCARAL